MKRCAIALILFFIFTSPAAADVKDDVKKGNLLYNNNKYAEAAKLYEEAASLDPSSGIGKYNLGLAKYKTGAVDAAVKNFNDAIASGKAALIPAADYNIANTQYRLGERAENSDIKKAKEFYETALKFYKRSIDLNPGDKDAKFNYEFVEKKLNDLAEKYQFKKDEKKDNKQDKNKDKQDKKQNQQQNQQQNQNQQSQQQDKQQQNQQSQGQGGEQDKGREGQGKGKDKGEGRETKDEGQGEQQKGEGQETKDDGREKKDEEKEQPKEGERKGGGQEEKEEEKQQEGPAAGGGIEEKKDKPEQGGLQAYQSPQSEGNGVEMSEQEAKMLLEGYKGEEATGMAVRMRKKKIDLPEPAKDW